MIEQIKEISENLYRIEDSCNVYLIRREDKCICVDFGTGVVLKYLKELNIQTVEAILLTHHHRDQAEGLEKAQNLGIPILVPETEQELLCDVEEMWQRREIYNSYNNRQDRFSILTSVYADRLQDYKKYLYLGMEFQILPTPGHTIGSISIVCEVERKKIAFTGDLIYDRGKLWSLAATQWSYNGGEGLPYTILSLLQIQDEGIDWMLPSHGNLMRTHDAVPLTVEKITRLQNLREQNPRLFLLRETPYEKITEHVLFNRTSMANSYVLLSKSGKALIIDFGYDFMAGTASGTDRSARRPWLYTIPILEKQFGVRKIDACIPTHYHDDHVAGMNLLKTRYGTKIFCPETYADILENPHAYDLPCLWYEPISVDKQISYSTPFQWEEYQIQLYPLSGHTRFSCAVFFEADNKRILCTGDQYAGEEGTLPNYVYKNLFSYNDFQKSAALYRKLKPDWILSGHWTKKAPDLEFYNKLEQIGKEVCELHRELLPMEGTMNPENDFYAVCYPYQKTVEAGEQFTVKVQRNQLGHKGKVRAELILPEGFQCCGESDYVFEDMEEIAEFTVKAPKWEVRRARIGCRIWCDNLCRGTQAEMLVTSKRR